MCMICHDESNLTTSMTPCNQSYHITGLLKWLQVKAALKKGVGICPVCNEELIVVNAGNETLDYIQQQRDELSGQRQKACKVGTNVFLCAVVVLYYS